VRILAKERVSRESLCALSESGLLRQVRGCEGGGLRTQLSGPQVMYTVKWPTGYVHS
jgi:hypothetical protein